MKYIKLFLITMLIPLLLTGCYNKKELDNLAYVIGIGADISNNEDLNITYQIAIPLKIGGENSKTGKETFKTYTVSAPSLYIGNSIVNTLTSKEVDLSHIKLIVYSEELAKKDLSGHINSLISNVAIRPKTSVAICKGRAEDFFNEVTPILEASPARYYDLILSSVEYTSESAETELLKFYSSCQAIDHEAVTIIAEHSKKISNEQALQTGIPSTNSEESPSSKVSTSSSENESGNGGSGGEGSGGEGTDIETRFAGLAVFKGARMVGEIPPNLVMGYLLLTNSLRVGTITVEDVKDPNKLTSIALSQVKNTEIDVTIENNIPKVKIKAYVDAHLESSNNITDYLDSKNKEDLKNKAEKQVTSIITAYLAELAKLDSDITGIGKYAKAKFTTWEDFKNANWQEIYKNCEFDVETEMNLNVSRIIFHRLPNE